MKVLILFYSAYGHVYRMAEAVARGVNEIEGVEPVVKRVPETLPEDVLKATGIASAAEMYSHVPVATLEDLDKADAIIFGTPTRFRSEEHTSELQSH